MGATARTPNPVEFLYRKDHLLVRDQDVMRLRAAGIKVKDVRYPVPGLALVRVQRGRQITVRGTCSTWWHTSTSYSAPGFATVDHMLHISVISHPGTHCPATEPDGVPRDARPRPAVSASRCDGRGSLVAVVDTGLPGERARAASVDARSRRGIEPRDLDTSTDYHCFAIYRSRNIHRQHRASDGSRARSAGRAHLRRKAGANFESEVVKALYGVIDWAPDIISLSAGTHTWKERGLLSFRVFVDGPPRERRGTVLVACAGNDGLDWKFSPAKMKGVLSVGALAVSGNERAWFYESR